MRALIPLVLSLLTGCAALTPGGEPYYPVLEGARLELLRPLSIPADSASVYLQDEGQAGYSGVDRYRPYCKLEMWTRTEAARTLEPDTFFVTRVVRDFEYVRRAVPVRVAAARFGLGFSLGVVDDDSGPMARIMDTEMFLASERQPDVYRLTCGRWDEPAFSRHLDLEDIRQALQGWFTLTPPAS